MLSQESFTYPWKDPRWGGKFVVGSVLSLAGYLIPVVPILFVLGYGVRLMRQTMAERTPRAPEWDNWADLGLQGLYTFLIYVVYMVPGILLILCSIVTFVAGQLLVSDRAREGLARGLVSWLVGSGPLSIALAVLIFLIGLLVLFAGTLLSPVAIARFAATGDLARSFELDEVWRVIRNQLGEFVVVWAVYLGYSYAVGFVTLILYYSVCLCLLIPVVAGPAYFYGLLVTMPLFANLYTRGSAVAPQAPAAPPDVPPPAPPPPGPGIAVSPGGSADLSSTKAPPEASPTDGSFPYQVAGPSLSVPVDPYEMSLDELNLPVRIQGCLMDAGLVTVGHIMEALRNQEGRLLEVKGFGPRSLEVVKDRLTHRGFAV